MPYLIKTKELLKRNRRHIVILQVAVWVCIIAVSYSRAAADSSKIILVENSVPKATVILSQHAGPDERAAATEFVRYIKKATGAQLPVVTTSGASNGTRILIGPSACSPAMRDRVNRLRDGGFVIQVTPDGSLIIAGNGKQGTSFAVYRFLETFAGIRWLWPGAEGEVIPQRKTLALGQVSIEQQPAFLLRNLEKDDSPRIGMDGWTAQLKPKISVRHQEAERLWELHSGFGGVRVDGGITWDKIVPFAKYGLSHPEYFASVDGKSGRQGFDGKHLEQIDITNPDVIRLTAAYVDRLFDSHPEYDAVSISPSYGGDISECQRNLEPGPKRDHVDPKCDSRRVTADQYIAFSNKVANLVAQKYPSKKLILLAEQPHELPPVDVKPTSNLIIQYPSSALLNWHPNIENRQHRDKEAWIGTSDNLAIFDDQIQGNNLDLPSLMPATIQRNLEQLSEQGYQYYQSQDRDGFAVNGLNYYVLARLLWNPSLNVNAIVRDYAEHGFGQAAPDVEQYFNRLESQWEVQTGKEVGTGDATLSEYERIAAAYPPSFLTACREDLWKIYHHYRLMKGKNQKRVQFLESGFYYVGLTLDAINKTIPLMKSGWTFVPTVSAPPGANLQDFEKALFAWKEREQYLERLRQDFVVSYSSVHAFDQHSNFVPLKQMEEFAQAHRLPVPSFNVSPPFTLSEARRLQSEIKSTFYVPEPLPQLTPKNYGQFAPTPDVIAERVTYGTQFGMRIPAILYLPKNHKGKLPAVIVVNGHGGDKYSWYAFYSGILYARAGAAVLTYDPVGEGERNIDRKSETRAHDKIEEPEAEMSKRLAGLMMTDLMQGVSYLSQRPEVDPKRIAAVGYSLGSFVVNLTCAVDARLHACVAAGGGDLDGPMEYWDNSKPMCTALPYQSLLFLGDRGAVLYALRSLIGPMLVFNGTADTIVDTPDHEEPWFQSLRSRVVQLRGTQKDVFQTGWNPGTSHRPYFVTRPVALWLERQLDFPNWTEASIEAMPTTHISEWARSNGLEIDRLYAVEPREGGVRALGAGVPALTRKELSVFTPEEWEQRKQNLIYENWVAKVEAH